MRAVLLMITDDDYDDKMQFSKSCPFRVIVLLTQVERQAEADGYKLITIV